MSDLPVDYVDRLNIREQIARIDLTQAQLRLALDEAAKLRSEQVKLDAEAGKLTRDRVLAPLTLAVTSIGAGAALFAAAQAVLRLTGRS